MTSDIKDMDLMTEVKTEWRSYRVTSGLSPGTAYQFRATAGSDQVGYGDPSVASRELFSLQGSHIGLTWIILSLNGTNLGLWKTEK